jgi:nucleoside diphosphate kinase
MASDAISYDKKELLAIARSFKAMDEQATKQAQVISSELADYVKSKVIDAAALTRTNTTGSVRIATGAVVSKSSKIGEISYGFARQKFSGGGTTQQLWGGLEFGSNTKKQFPVWSGKEGRGSRGWFIYPTLRSIQPEILKRWEQAFVTVIKEFD